MNNEQKSALASLSSDGYAVIVWTPEELGNVSARVVENRSIELGHQIIEEMKTGREEPCGSELLLREEMQA